MAVGWPDFSQATITDAATFDALKRAYAERCAAACAGTGHAVYHDAEYWGADATPDLDRLIQFRKAMMALAPKFVRLEDERYAQKSWSNFPIAYAGADLMKGEHSLAVLPAPATPEGDSARLADYRTFLENCAWWLKRFRYVNVAPQSYYTRKSTARGSRSVRDSDTWGHEETGEPVGNYLARPEHEELSGRRVVRVSGTWMVSFDHAAQWAAEDVYYYRDKQWRYDTWVYEWEEVDAEAYSGMVVRNGSGLSGKLLLVPAYYHSYNGAFPTRNVERDLIETLIPDPPDDDPIDFIAGVCHYKTEHYDKHGNEWLQTYDQDFRGEQWWGEVTEYSAKVERNGHCVYTTTKWSDDGTRSYTTQEEDDWEGWYNYTIHQSSECRIWDFDGFGEWTLGETVEGGIVEPHGQAEPIPKIETIPKPDVWDLGQFDPDPVRIHPRDQWRTVYRQAYLRVVPILDFNQSYQHQDT